MDNEKCIVCGVETDVPKNLHIDLRTCYVEGCGQLCPKCYRRIYGTGYQMTGSNYNTAF